MRSSWDLRLALWSIRCLALALPAADRERWRREWAAELAHRAGRTEYANPLAQNPKLAWIVLTAALPDVWHLARQEWRIDSMWSDFKFALRGFQRAPVFSAVAVITLALGVGANTAAYSVVHGVLLDPLDAESPDELVMIWETNVERGWTRFTVSPANYLDWRAQAAVFESMAAYTTGSHTLTGHGDPFAVRAAFVTPELFHVLRVPSPQGAFFTADHSDPARANVAVLSNAFWRTAFGADPEVIGRTITLDGVDVSVIGIAPQRPDLAQFFRGNPVQVLRPMSYDYDPRQARGAHFLAVAARLAPSITVDRAAAEMDQVANRLAAAHPETNTGWGTNVVPLKEQILGPNIRTRLYVIWAAVGFVLLIACANIANLLLTRMSSRHNEIAIRIAMGARRGRLTRQFLIEGMLLTGVGALLGLGLAFTIVGQIVRLDPGNIPRISNVSIDGAVLLFTLGVTTVVGIGFGLFPLMRTVDPGHVLRSRRGTTDGARSQRFRTLLVVGEVAIAIVIAIGSALLARSFFAMQSADPGYEASGVIVFELRPPTSRYQDMATVHQLYDQIMDGIRDLPGVQFVGSGAPAPLGGDMRWSYSILGGPAEHAGTTSALFRRVRGQYFETLGIPVIAGRTFDERDRASSTPVIIINQAFAQRYFGDTSPLGRQIEVGTGSAACPCEIVGVVGNVRQYGITGDVDLGLYVPASQLDGFRNQTILVKTDPDRAPLGAAIRSVVAAADPLLPVNDYGQFANRVADSLASPRFTMALIGSFAALAVVLAVVGIYGLLAYTVRLRTPELGVRLALGASPGAVRGTIVRYAVTMSLVGAAVGVILAAGLARYLSSLLFGIGTLDAISFAAIPISLILVGSLAALGPARRASRVDPIQVLREE